MLSWSKSTLPKTNVNEIKILVGYTVQIRNSVNNKKISEY